jgi:hypothetical protein
VTQGEGLNAAHFLRCRRCGHESQREPVIPPPATWPQAYTYSDVDQQF